MSELQEKLQQLSGTKMDAQGAANVWAGTTGLDLVGALNRKAGTVGLELDGVLNALAHTSGYGTNGAATALSSAPAGPALRAGSTTSSAGAAGFSVSLTVPAAVQAGDLMVAVVSNSFAGSASWSAPSGWTMAVNQTTSNQSTALFYKLAVGGDLGASLTWSGPGGNDTCAVFAAFSGIKSVSPVDVQGGTNGASPLASSSITTTLANDLVVYGFGYWKNPTSGLPAYSGALTSATVEVLGSGSRSYAGLLYIVQSAIGASASITETLALGQLQNTTVAFKSA